MKKNTNKLIRESSPYLLQHAENPVEWEAWGTEILKKAKTEGELLLISIGYSSCHWCHVMAHESFENEAVAKLMNAHFINIKVDREERPDVDQVYMNALQLMTGQGGWPLNIVALPDGRPVWGGTYLPKEQWMDTLRQITDLYEKDPEKMRAYAEKLSAGMQQMELLAKSNPVKTFDLELLENMLSQWKTRFDWEWGGTSQAPKFMLPNNCHFLLRHAFQTKNKKLMDFVKLTLDKISFGGVFDHIGGGFSRYSTDAKWHIPHFEKMLYDNAQLVSLYCDAFLATKNPWYQKVVFKTLEFVERELTGKEGQFYSALDADSLNPDGILEEGAHYVWTRQELRTILKKDFDVFSAFYNINEFGLWEKEIYVLIRKEKTRSLAEQFSLSEQEVVQKIEACNKKLLQKRSERARPGLDDKSLTSWNALMIKAYADAFRVFRKKEHLDAALKTARFLLNNLLKPDNTLHHTYKNGKTSVNGFLEDYAFTLEAFIALYENTFDEKWLQLSNNLATTVFENFNDPENPLFFFSSKQDESLIARTKEQQDNVLPSSNSVMAKNLFKLSHFFGNQKFQEYSERMLKGILPQAEHHPEAFSNWLDLLLNCTQKFYEIAITGEKAFKKIAKLNTWYLPNKILAATIEESEMPLLKNRFEKGKTLIFPCVENTCQMPVEKPEEVIKIIFNKN